MTFSYNQEFCQKLRLLSFYNILLERKRKKELYVAKLQIYKIIPVPIIHLYNYTNL